MPSIIIFFIILSVLVIIHELGHFWAARKVGVKVLEFGLGLPPKIFGKRFKGTIYSLNLLPFGGFVRLKGEDQEQSEVSKDSSEEVPGIQNEVKSDSFVDKSPKSRAFVVVAGVVMNFILAVVLFQIVLFSNNFKSNYIPLFYEFEPVIGNLESRSTMISGFSEDTKLDKESFKPGDYVYSVNGQEISSFQNLREVVNASEGGTATLVVKNLRDVSFIREVSVSLIEKDGQKFLGMILTKAGRISYDGWLQPFAGFFHSINVSKFTFTSMGYLISKAFELGAPEIVTENVSGPVGIYRVVDIIASESNTPFSLEMLDLIALLSLSLAIMNILPIPAVDGGRLVFIIYEMIVRRKPNPKIEIAVNKYGMLVLLGLLLAVTFKDVSQLINN